MAVGMINGTSAFGRQPDLPQLLGAHSVDDDIDDFLALQAALGKGPSRLVATLHGALLALAIALRAPTRVASLVLAEPPLYRWLRPTKAGEHLYDALIHDVGGRLAKRSSWACIATQCNF